MQIFLSHSAADGIQAEQVHLALQELGHEVFFDRSSLPTGESFNDRIRSAIQECEVFVFLVSRNSLREGSYCLTELKFIAERWPHPHGRVLPVLLEPMPSKELPPYLRAVTYLEPRGSVAAETAEAVQRLLRRYKRGHLAWAAAAIALVALVIAGLNYERVTQAANFDVQELALSHDVRELGRGGDVAALSVTIANDTSRPRTLTSVRLETDSAECEMWLSDSDAVSAPQRKLPLAQAFAPREAQGFRWRVQPRLASNSRGAWEEELAGSQWRLAWCWHDQSESRTAWQPWKPAGVLANSALRPLPRDLRQRARCVTERSGDSDSLLLAVANDDVLLELPREGAPIERARLGAEPVAVAAGESLVVAATLSPTPLWIFDAASWKSSGPFALQTWDIPTQHGGGRFSVQPRELAVWEGDVWIRTGDARHPPQVTQFLPEVAQNRIPFRTHYDYDLARELFEPLWYVRFATIGGKLWGAKSGRRSSGLCSFWQGELVLYDSHPADWLRAARDVAEGPGGTFLLLDQSDQLTELVYEDGAFRLARTLGPIVLSDSARRPWIDYLIAARGERIVVAITLYEREPVDRMVSTRFATWEPRAGLQILATVPAWEIVSLATTESRGLAVLKSGEGEYDAVWIDYASVAR